MQLPLPKNEVARVHALRSHWILDTPAEKSFDDLARLTSYLCGTPIAFIGFMDSDRLWFKAHVGWDICEIPRDMAFCAHTINQSDVLVAPDTLEDLRFKSSLLATQKGIRFYAGVSLMSVEGYALGTLCTMDTIPRGLTEGQISALRKLGGQAMTLLELRRLAFSASVKSHGSETADEAQNQSQETEPSWRTLVENTREAIIEFDEDNRILYLNAATEALFNYPKAEILRQPLTTLIPGYDGQAMNADSKNCVELPGLGKGGNEVSLEVLFGDCQRQGKRTFFATCRDISRRRQSEDERARLAAMVVSSEDAIIGKDLDCVITAWNKGAERIYGYSAQEVIGKPLSILAPPEHGHEISEIVEKLKRGERIENYETVRIARGGKRIRVALTVSPMHDETGKLVGFSVVGRDISEQKRAQDALRHSEQRLQGIIGSAMDAIITVDRAQRIVVFNKAAEQIFRCSAAEAIGQTIDKFIPEKFRASHREHIQGFAKTGVTARSMYSPGTLLALRADGEEFPIEATISQVETEGEKLFTVILRDISARLRMETELRQAQKMEAVGQLAGGIAHEFNNFLGVILGYSELLSEEAVGNEKLGQHVTAIRAATQHAGSLTRQLLAFSRKQVLEPQILDPNRVIWDSHKLLRRLVPANIDVVPVLAPAIGRVRMDPGQLQQILINLLVNARDAMRQGGKVIIETADAELDAAYVSQHVGLQPGSYVLLSITDSGAGMNDETRSRLFEPFYTTKEPGKGTGLGLSTVYGIVKHSRGHISVETSPGQGTTFRIYLPRVEAAATEECQVNTSGPSQRIESATILVVEDESALRRLLSVSLQKRNHTVLMAKDGAEAVEIFRQNADQIQLVVTDLMMPRMDGLELKKRIAALKPEVKFLFMSGYADEIVEQHRGSLNGCAFLEKPFLPEELANKVSGILAGDAAA